MKAIYFIKYFIFLLHLVKNYIVMPLERLIDIYSDNDTIVALNIINNTIYSYIDIGTPPQKIPFKISLRNTMTFVVDKSNPYGSFDTEKSSSIKCYKDKKSNFVFEIIKQGFPCKDDIKLNNDENKIITLKNMNIPVATELDNTYYFNGYIGLKTPISYKEEWGNFIYDLKQRKAIDSYIYCFNFTKDFQKDSGKLIIGKYPHQYEPEKFDPKDIIKTSSLEIGSNNDWFMKMNEIIIDKKIFEIKGKSFILNPENGMISMSLELGDYFYTMFFAEYIKENKCIKQYLKYREYVFICEDSISISKFNDIKLRHKSMEFDFILNYNDLFYHFYDRYFFLIIFKDSFFMELGKPFMLKYNPFFNIDSKQIGFYTKIKEIEEKKIGHGNIILIVLLVIFIPATIFLGYKAYTYRIKTLRKNQLDDGGYDYSTKKESKLYDMSYENKNNI